MSATDDAIAAYLAKGGKITRVAADERTLTEREIYLARRGETNDPTQERHVAAIDHMGRAWIVNGLGETIATE